MTEVQQPHTTGLDAAPDVGSGSIAGRLDSRDPESDEDDFDAERFVDAADVETDGRR